MAMNSNPHGRVPRVLLVDDAPDNRLLMSLYLRRSGVEILTARNGEEALQLAASKLPDLVLIDIGMGGMSCYEVCKRIKANPATSQTPVVFLLNTNEREERIRGLQVGADNFFRKPIQKEEFLVRVKSLITAYKTRKEQADSPVTPDSGMDNMRDDYSH